MQQQQVAVEQQQQQQQQQLVALMAGAWVSWQPDGEEVMRQQPLQQRCCCYNSRWRKGSLHSTAARFSDRINHVTAAAATAETPAASSHCYGVAVTLLCSLS
jgi:hypothetical protein